MVIRGRGYVSAGRSGTGAEREVMQPNVCYPTDEGLMLGQKEKVGVPRSAGSQPTFAVLSMNVVNASSGPRCWQVWLQSRLARQQFALRGPAEREPTVQRSAFSVR